MANLELKTASGGSVTLVPEDGVDNVTALIKHIGGTLVNEDDIANVVRDIDFTQSLDAGGWQRLPSGLIIQWGVFYTSIGGSSANSFPISLSNSIYSIIAAPVIAASSNGVFATVESVTLSGANFSTWTESGARNNVSGYYIVIGK